MRELSRFLPSALLVLLGACGGGGGGTNPPAANVQVSVTGPSAPIAPGATAQFTATVTGTTNQAVTWSVDPIGPVNVGTVSGTGLYTAPAAAGTFTVRATSAADSAKSGAAQVTVSAPAITVSVTPASPTVVAGGTVQLAASVTNASNPNVTWETTGGSVSPATASTTTTFTAPGTAGTVTVTARSVADATKTATATITITAAGNLTLSPAALSIVPGGTQQFTALLGGSPTAAVAWSLLEGAVAGTVSGAGLYTAGGTVGTYTLRATLNADPAKTATALVTVATAVTLQILPGTMSIRGGDAGNFSYQIDPSGILRDVTWSITEGAAGGTITTDFGSMVYVPPTVGATTTVHVKATSVADPSKSSTATVTVDSPPGSAPLPLLATSMAASRMKHAAVALADGRMLITGGSSDARNNQNTDVAELYLPASRTFQTVANPTGKLRNDHTATLLADGRVLITGGDTGWESPDRASAEVFNPAGGTFTPAANAMSVLRGSGHRAFRLESGPHAGKVLVLGGAPYYYISDATASADLFDPATSTFSPAPNAMRDARTRFALTRLQDGRWLITGGSKSSSEPDLATAEIFNPADMTFTRTTGNMVRGRLWHTATLLNNGKVLIAGGYSEEDRAELFDPAPGPSTDLPRMREGRYFHTATLQADGRVRIAGGRNTYVYRVLGSTELFDPASNTFSYGARLATPRESHTALSISGGADNGKILILGGTNGNTKATAEILD